MPAEGEPARRADAIERDIAATRRDMSRTAAEIERRLSPQGLLDGAMGWLRTSDRGRALVDDVTAVVARNPLPLALVGVGVAWMAFEMSRGESERSPPRPVGARRLGVYPRTPRRLSQGDVIRDPGAAMAGTATRPVPETAAASAPYATLGPGSPAAPIRGETPSTTSYGSEVPEPRVVPRDVRSG